MQNNQSDHKATTPVIRCLIGALHGVYGYLDVTDYLESGGKVRSTPALKARRLKVLPFPDRSISPVDLNLTAEDFAVMNLEPRILKEIGVPSYILSKMELSDDALEIIGKTREELSEEPKVTSDGKVPLTDKTDVKQTTDRGNQFTQTGNSPPIGDPETATESRRLIKHHRPCDSIIAVHPDEKHRCPCMFGDDRKNVACVNDNLGESRCPAFRGIDAIDGVGYLHCATEEPAEIRFAEITEANVRLRRAVELYIAAGKGVLDLPDIFDIFDLPKRTRIVMAGIAEGMGDGDVGEGVVVTEKFIKGFAKSLYQAARVDGANIRLQLDGSVGELS